MRACTLVLIVVLCSPSSFGDEAGTKTSPSPVAAPTAAKVEALVAPWIASEQLVGVVVGVIDGEHESVFGFGRLAYGSETVPDADTVFEIGSISKVFTGILLALAAQQDDVTVEDPVQRHVPEGVTVPTKGEQPITLAHLSTHSSGLPRMPSNFAPQDPNDPYADYDTKLLYAFLNGHALRRGPGTKHEYSNLAAGLLGSLLSRDIDGGYAALIQKEIAGPLGMTSTALSLTPDMAKRFAAPHLMDTAAAHAWTFDALAGAGGIRSTVRDMLRFARLTLSPPDTPLGRAAATASALARKGAPGESDMGLGWVIAPDGHRWHNGQTGGFHSFLGVNAKTGRAVVVLSNTATGVVDRCGNDILKLLAGEDVELPDVEPLTAVDSKQLARYAGSYTLGPMKLPVTIRCDGTRLLVQLDGQPELRVFPKSATEFAYRIVEARIVFDAEGEDLAPGFVLHQNGMQIPAARTP